MMLPVWVDGFRARFLGCEGSGLEACQALNVSNCKDIMSFCNQQKQLEYNNSGVRKDRNSIPMLKLKPGTGQPQKP